MRGEKERRKKTEERKREGDYYEILSDVLNLDLNDFK